MRQWRVGSLSMGIFLIVLGAALLLNRIGGIDASEILFKWWPVILILLGLEILGHEYFSKGTSPKIKYDGISVFIIIIILVFSFGAFIVSFFSNTNGRLTFSNGIFDNYKYNSQFTKKVNINAGNSNKLRLINSYGKIQIQQSDGNIIEVTAEINIRNNDEKYAKEVSDKVVEIEKGSEISVATNTSDYLDKTKIQFVEVNYTIKVPSKISVAAENEYGDVTAEDVDGNLNILDKNANIDVSSVSGDLTINNEYGEINAHDIKGMADITDKNGNIKLDDVKETAKLYNEYGNIELKNIGGNVSINNKNALINGDVFLGNVDIDSEYCDINVSDITGLAKLVGKNGQIAVNNVGGELGIKNAYGNVDVNNANNAIDISDKNGNIKVNNNNHRIITGKVDLTNEYGNIEMNIPSNQNANIKATTEYGEINNNGTKLKMDLLEKDNVKSLNEKLGKGGIDINITTNNGNIEFN